MALSKKEKIQMINSLSPANKKAIMEAIEKHEQMGQGGEGFWSSLGKGLKEIVIALGPTLIKEVLVPIVKKKVLGEGLNLAGKKRGRGRPKKSENIMNM
jgi:hypothetical protein